MSWVIAILLTLILVALTASDKSAAVAVKRVLRIVLIGTVLLALTAAITLFFVWFHIGYASEDWWQTGPALLVFLCCSLWAWTARKEIAAKYNEDRRKVILKSVKVLAFVAFILLGSYLLNAALEAFQVSGWWLIGGVLAASGLLLIVQTAASPKRWREVWFGPPEVPYPGEVVLQARWQAEDEERARYVLEVETREELTADELDAFWRRRDERLAATEIRIAEIQLQAEVAKAKQVANSRLWNATVIFWPCALVGALGLVPLYWRLGFDWAMTLEIVKDRAWFATAIVVGGGFVIAGGVLSIAEELDKFIRSRKGREVGPAGAD